jgi:hypothetical protein
MIIRVDVPIEKESSWSAEGQFFISVPISEEEGIAFNCTFGNEGIIKQARKGKTETHEKPTDVWRTLVIEDGEVRPERSERAEWIDKGEDAAIVNGDIWLTKGKVELPQKVKGKLLEFSSKIYAHKDNLDKIEGVLSQLDSYIENLVNSERVQGLIES